MSANRQRGCRPETEAKYADALQLYATTDLPKAEICRRCGVTVNGFARFLGTYHRDLLLRRNGIKCPPDEVSGYKFRQRRGQYPATRRKYRDAIEACDSLEYIQSNVSEIAREFGLSGTNLSNQLRKHYPGLLEYREKARQKLGLDDGLPRGMRPWAREQYAPAVELLRGDRYITVREAADICGVSYPGLEQHLVFYHKDLVDNRIAIRGKALNRKEKGEITGRGTLHLPTPELNAKYAEALRLYTTTNLPARQIARRSGVPVKGFYEYLQRWHKELTGGRAWTAEKYGEAIVELKKGDKTIAGVAEKTGVNADALRQYIKEHEPGLHASLGRVRSENGKLVSTQSMEKYKEAIHLFETTEESLRSIARRLGLNEASLRQFIKRQFPDLITRRKEKKQKND